LKKKSSNFLTYELYENLEYLLLFSFLAVSIYLVFHSFFNFEKLGRLLFNPYYGVDEIWSLGSAQCWIKNPLILLNRIYEPLYALLFTPFLFLSPYHILLVGRLSSSFFSFLTLFFFSKILRLNKTDRKLIILTLFLFVFHPLFLFFSAAMMSEVFFSFLLCLFFYCLLRRKIKSSFILAIMLPFVRTEGIIYTSFYFLYLFFNKRYKLVIILFLFFLSISLVSLLFTEDIMGFRICLEHSRHFFAWKFQGIKTFLDNFWPFLFFISFYFLRVFKHLKLSFEREEETIIYLATLTYILFLVSAPAILRRDADLGHFLPLLPPLFIIATNALKVIKRRTFRFFAYSLLVLWFVYWWLRPLPLFRMNAEVPFSLIDLEKSGLDARVENYIKDDKIERVYLHEGLYLLELQNEKCKFFSDKLYDYYPFSPWEFFSRYYTKPFFEKEVKKNSIIIISTTKDYNCETFGGKLIETFPNLKLGICKI